jgi:hypothetical protein
VRASNAACVAFAMSGRKPARRAQHEDAAVPGVAAFGEVALGDVELGLFFEAQHARRAAVGRRLALDVAVAGFRAVGRDAEDHDRALRGGAHGVLKCARERRAVGRGLVGRRHHHHGVAAALHGLNRRERHRRCGVAPRGFEHQRADGRAQFAQLVEHQEAVVFVRDRDRRGDLEIVGRDRGQARDRLLVERLVAVGQREELLRETGARQRPQPRAAAAGHHDRLDVDCRASWSGSGRSHGCIVKTSALANAGAAASFAASEGVILLVVPDGPVPSSAQSIASCVSFQMIARSQSFA